MFVPTLFLLRLADRNQPAMDQLYYYVRKMDVTINKVTSVLDSIESTIRESTGCVAPVIPERDVLKFYLNEERRSETVLTSLSTKEIVRRNDGDSEDEDDDGPIPDDLCDSDDEQMENVPVKFISTRTNLQSA